MKIGCISDTHGKTGIKDLKIDPCDVLVCGGDHTCHGYLSEFEVFCDWVVSQPVGTAVVVGGNHDRELEAYPLLAREICSTRGLHYLENSSVTIHGIKFWGSPYSVEFCGWHFMREDRDLAEIWQEIPLDADVVVVHGPALGINDLTSDIVHAGSATLYEWYTKNLPKISLFCTGHIHEARGITEVWGTQFVNPSVLDDDYNFCGGAYYFDFEVKDGGSS